MRNESHIDFFGLSSKLDPGYHGLDHAVWVARLFLTIGLAHVTSICNIGLSSEMGPSCRGLDHPEVSADLSFNNWASICSKIKREHMCI